MSKHNYLTVKQVLDNEFTTALGLKRVVKEGQTKISIIDFELGVSNLMYPANYILGEDDEPEVFYWANAMNLDKFYSVCANWMINDAEEDIEYKKLYTDLKQNMYVDFECGVEASKRLMMLCRWLGHWLRDEVQENMFLSFVDNDEKYFDVADEFEKAYWKAIDEKDYIRVALIIAYVLSKTLEHASQKKLFDY